MPFIKLDRDNGELIGIADPSHSWKTVYNSCGSKNVCAVYVPTWVFCRGRLVVLCLLSAGLIGFGFSTAWALKPDPEPIIVTRTIEHFTRRRECVFRLEELRKSHFVSHDQINAENAKEYMAIKLVKHILEKPHEPLPLKWKRLLTKHWGAVYANQYKYTDGIGVGYKKR